MLKNLLDLHNNLSVRDVHEEEKSSRSTGVFNKIISFNIVSQVLYFWSNINRSFGSSGRISWVI